jgi:hypothetical protein
MISMNDRAVSETFLMDRLEEVLSICGEDILDRIGTGHVSPAAYDTGFVARISDEEGSPEFPQTLDWLVANQRDDGSWGANIHHEYDRFINTLSAGIALKERDRAPEAVAMAEAYLSEAIHRLEGADEGITSDHLVAMLLEEAREAGMEIPYEHSPHRPMGPLKKLLLSWRCVDPEHPVGHFVELLGRFPSQKRVTQNLQMPDGSIMNSTSSTAASIVFDSRLERDHAYYDKLIYLRDSMVDGGGVRHFWDLDVMETAYGLYNLMRAGYPQHLISKRVALLEENWGADGLGFSRHFRASDLDDTALGHIVLNYVGREPDPKVFDAYWEGDHFVTYTVESRGRPGPNIHALEALALSSHPDKDNLIDATLRWLRGEMVAGNHFVDEWHLSPAYATSHAIFAFHLTEETLMERCVDYFLDTQRDDGSWGNISNGNGLGTIEETAFALQGLLYYDRNVRRVDPEVVHNGIGFILDNYPTVQYPEMWVSKVLYAPGNIIESLVQGVLHMFRHGGAHPGKETSPSGNGRRLRR